MSADAKYTMNKIDELVGMKVTGAAHSEAFGDDMPGILLEGEDANGHRQRYVAWVMRDEEGNGPGSLDVQPLGNGCGIPEMDRPPEGPSVPVEIIRTQTQVDNVIVACSEQQGKGGSRWFGLTFEDGVRSALEWVTGDQDDCPLEGFDPATGEWEE